MALKEYHEVNENGERIAVHVFDDKIDEIPSNCFKGWGNRVLFNAIWDFSKNDWVEGENSEEVLEVYKQGKDMELNEACKESILKGFTHEVNGIEYHFSFDSEAQFNFQGAERLFSTGQIDEIRWTVKNMETGEYERILITKEVMEELVMKILQHKDSNISKYRDFLLPIVKSAETIEEIETIKW